jgi:hypothetical protein
MIRAEATGFKPRPAAEAQAADTLRSELLELRTILFSQQGARNWAAQLSNLRRELSAAAKQAPVQVRGR